MISQVKFRLNLEKYPDYKFPKKLLIRVFWVNALFHCFLSQIV